MNNGLNRGQVLVARGMHAACVVEDLLGEGGQAEVYRARVGPAQYALKWYFPHYLNADPRLWERLRRAIDNGPPNDKFLWPFDLVSHQRHDAVGGYLMPLKPPAFISLVDLLRRQVEPTFRTLARVGFHLADSFFHLHTAGLCYRDINFGNIFFQPETGDIRIGDTDNVDVNRRPGGIMGTWGFMAPEVSRREAEPSAMTDRYSLAVLLFFVFMLGHPLRGKRENTLPYDASDPDGSRRLCSDDPVFIFDPNNESNRPMPGIHDVMINFWPVYPESLQQLFVRSFTAGLFDVEARVMENEWRNEMCTLADTVFHCASCTAENFFDLGRMRRKLGIAPCWCCKSTLPLPPRMRLTSAHDPAVVVLSPGMQLFPHHLEADRYNFSTPLAQVVAKPFGLRNLSRQPWTSRRTEDSSLLQIAPGETLYLHGNCRVNFGKAEGEIKV